MEKPETEGPQDPMELECNRMLSEAIREVYEGTLPAEMFSRLARSRDEYTVRYCLRRMADPILELWEERLLSRALQHSGAVRRFLDLLASRAREPADAITRTFDNAERQSDIRLPVHVQSEDVALVMRALDSLEGMEQDPGLVPFLFALLVLDAPQIQSKVSLLIQKWDLHLRYTRRLLDHPIPRVRANALEVLAERRETRALEYFRSLAGDSYSRVRALAGIGLCRLEDPLGWEIVMALVRHPLAPERRSGVWALGMCGKPEHASLLEYIAQSDADSRVRELARNALEKTTKAQRPDDPLTS